MYVTSTSPSEDKKNAGHSSSDIQHKWKEMCCAVMWYDVIYNTIYDIWHDMINVIISNYDGKVEILINGVETIYIKNVDLLINSG